MVGVEILNSHDQMMVSTGLSFVSLFPSYFTFRSEGLAGFLPQTHPWKLTTVPLSYNDALLEDILYPYVI